MKSKETGERRRKLRYASDLGRLEREKTLQESEERFRKIFEDGPLGMAIIGLDYRFAKVNQALCRMLGYTEQELTALKFPDITHPEDVESDVKLAEKVFNGQIPYYEIEKRYIKKNKDVLWTALTASVIRDKDGKALYGLAMIEDITQRKSTREQYETIVHTAMDGFWRTDTSGRFLDVNDAYCHMIGCSRAELLKMRIQDVEAKESAEETAQHIKTIMETGSDRFETRHRRKDGKLIDIEVSTNYLPFDDGQLVVFLRDITERKRMEDELRRRAQELNALQETVLDITGRRDLPTLLNSIVERAARLLNAPSGGMYLCDPERQEVRCVVACNTKTNPVGTVLKYGEGAAGFVAGTRKPLIIDDYRTWSGRAAVFERDRPFSAVLSVPMIWQGQITGVIHILDNKETRRFTQADLELLCMFANHAAIAVENARLLDQEQDHAEELTRYSTNLEQQVLERTSKLADSEKRFRELADLLPQIVFEIDEQGSFLFVNRIAFATTGYTEDDLSRGLNAFQMIALRDRDRVKQKIGRLLAGEKLGGDEYTVQRKDGSTFPVSVYAAPMMRGNRAVGLRGIIIDISERKRMEDSLLRSERLAAVGETAAMVGHDLRNPLQGIITAAYAIKQQMGSKVDETTKEMLELIEKDVRYSDRIVNNLLDYSKDLHIEPTETTPKSITEDALHCVTMPRNIVVHDLTEHQPRLKVDVESIQRVFVNIIENAIQAMLGGGELTIQTKKSNSNLVATFTDTGEGMTEGDMNRLWRPLVSTKARGIGLGLAICKRIVEAHGGTISAESTVGKGTTITVTLPIRPRVEEVSE